MTSERRLERVLAESQSRQQQFQEHLSHALSSALTARVDKVVREEMKKTVPQSTETVQLKSTLIFFFLQDSIAFAPHQMNCSVEENKSRGLFF